MSPPKATAQLSEQEFLDRVHEQPERRLARWLSVPAHIHHTAHHMSNPPVERPRSREEFRHVLTCLGVRSEDAVVDGKFGFGARIEPNGDRLLIIWEAHTEYYSYQIWHIAGDPSKPLRFGPIALPNSELPICPLGTLVNSLDIILRVGPDPSLQQIRSMIPGHILYGSRICGENITAVTSFLPDDARRERYLVYSPSHALLEEHVSRIIDGIATLENYYHLILRPFPAFSRAIDQIHEFEQRHLRQQQLITEQLSTSTSTTLNGWINDLTQDFLHVSRLAEAMRYQLSPAVPYESILRVTVRSIQEQPVQSFRPLSEYVLGRITGIADGYQQLIRRIDAMHTAFEGLLSLIRTRAELLIERQNLALLESVEQNTKRQAILQLTVESLTFIVISYYLTSLANFAFGGLHGIGWIDDVTVATAVFVPIAIVVSFVIVLRGHKAIARRLASDRRKSI